MTMLYNWVLMALIANQVLAQDEYDTGYSSDYIPDVSGDTAYAEPTEPPYVAPDSDGAVISDATSENTTNATDPSATVVPLRSANDDTAAQSDVTSEYASSVLDPSGSTNYDSAATAPIPSDYPSDVSQASPSTSNSTSINPQATTESPPPSTPQVYMHIKWEKDTSKCLAIFDTSHQDDTPVV